MNSTMPESDYIHCMFCIVLKYGSDALEELGLATGNVRVELLFSRDESNCAFGRPVSGQL